MNTFQVSRMKLIFCAYSALTIIFNVRATNKVRDGVHIRKIKNLALYIQISEY